MEDFKKYLQSKNLSPITIREYSRELGRFILWYGNEDIANVQKKDVLNYLGYLKNKKNLQTVSSNHGLIALRHCFDCLMRQGNLNINPASLIILRGLKRKKLHHTYNPEELEKLADNFYQLHVKTASEKTTLPKWKDLHQNSYYAQMRNYVMLQFFVYQGLTTREVLELRTDDIQLHKATITIPSGTQRGNARTLPINAIQIGSLMQYLQSIRPQLVNPDSTILFLPTMQGGKVAQAKIALIYLSKALKQIDQNYNSFTQLRASLITYWIQTYGLRKAQYLAGHKSINSTEEFLLNDIEGLTDDIIKFNPF